MDNIYIDERANVSHKAFIGEGSYIEPNVFVGPDVQIGRNCTLMANSYISGKTTVGDNCKIFPSAVIGTITQAVNYAGGESGVIIGDNNIIREFVTINATEGTQKDYTYIGNDNLIMAYCHVAHHCCIKNSVILSNAATLAGHVEVESNAILGGLAALHQFVKIGKFTIIGGMSKIVKDIPPYLKVDGNPAKVSGLNVVAFERNNFSKQKSSNLKEIYKIVYRSGLNVSQAVLKLKKSGMPESDEFIKFIENSERGILFKT
ncbi:MAG: acyl-ACP--UDP-N-acetylglucosamine O-acyltransferase [Candidatus Muiribacteriota bacterium]